MAARRARTARFVVKRMGISQNNAVPGRHKKSCPPPFPFGENLAGLRKGQNWTQETVAEKIGTTTRFIQYLEAGRRIPNVKMVGRLKRVFECTWEQLLEGCERDLK